MGWWTSSTGDSLSYLGFIARSPEAGAIIYDLRKSLEIAAAPKAVAVKDKPSRIAKEYAPKSGSHYRPFKDEGR